MGLVPTANALCNEAGGEPVLWGAGASLVAQRLRVCLQRRALHGLSWNLSWAEGIPPAHHSASLMGRGPQGQQICSEARSLYIKARKVAPPSSGGAERSQADPGASPQPSAVPMQHVELVGLAARFSGPQREGAASRRGIWRIRNRL